MMRKIVDYMTLLIIHFTCGSGNCDKKKAMVTS